MVYEYVILKCTYIRTLIQRCIYLFLFHFGKQDSRSNLIMKKHKRELKTKLFDNKSQQLKLDVSMMTLFLDKTL